MSLATYHKKRQFTRTPEPRGKTPRARKSALSFVIQKHDASRLHYDFRLELDGVLKSWAVPKGPSLDPKRKALAVQVEDHPIEYGDFEGIIPEGQYGGGTVLLWDHGTWEPLHDPHEGFKSGKLHFVLKGKKLRGEWALVQMHGKAGDDGKNWLLFKTKDKYADRKSDITADKPKSVKSRRTIEQIAKRRDAVWDSHAKTQAVDLPGAEPSPLPKDFTPQLAVLSEHPPRGEEWIHEIKFDGYRILAFVQGGKVKLLTRKGNDWTDKFSSIAKSLEKLRAESAIVDGEAVVLDKNGRSDFQALQRMLKSREKVRLTYYAFDLPFCNGVDLTHTPLVERKRVLKEILDTSDLGPGVAYSGHIQGDGAQVLGKACDMSLEGIISKLADSAYVSRRDASWLKSKCHQRQEFVIIGWTDPQGARSGFGSLLLGYHDDQKRLVYAGRVGTGFNEKRLKELHRTLDAMAQADAPTDLPVPARERRDAHWVQPKLVAEVRFSGWTQDNLLRHPAFIALRDDKPASQIVREKAVEPEHGKEIQMTRKANPRRLRLRGSKTPRQLSRETASGADPAILADVKLTHPDRVLYPDVEVTKQQVAEYYQSVEKWMLPHVADRPLALVRCPDGLASKCFFQRNWSNTLPGAIDKVDVSDSRKKENHITIHDIAGVVSLVQMSVLEIHTWGCHNDDIEHPDQIIFDLDPGEDVPWKRVIEGARILRRTLDDVGLPTFLKTSGGKGLHLTIPIEPTIGWDAAKAFCETVVKSLAENSTMFVANMRKDLRGGKIYIDYHRNGRSATAVAPYSTRARNGAPVSMPISWEELGKLSSAAHFTVETARRYLDKRKQDPWRDFHRSRIDLEKLAARRSAA